MTTDAKRYELSYILRPSLDEAGLKTITDALLALINEHGGEVDASDEPTRTHLGYPIVGTRDSFVGSMRFSVDPDKIEEVRAKTVGITGVVRTVVHSWAKDIEQTHRAVRTFTGERQVETPAASTEAIDAQLSEALTEESLKHA